MKIFKSIVGSLCVVYVAACLFGSVMVSNGGYDVLRWRKPLLFVEVSSGVVVDYNTDGYMDGVDEFGAYRAYHNRMIGEEVTSVFIYNPLNNYFDDILFRFDI